MESAMKLNDKTILITGGTSGIGFELAKKLLATRNTVVITGRNRDRLQKAQQELRGVHVFQSDVSEPAEIALLHREVLAKFPRLSVVINNAGIMRNLNLNVAQASDVTSEIEVNLSGPILLNQIFLPHLLQQNESLIVNVSSGLALIPFTISPVYSAAKAGLHAYTKCLRAQMKGTSVRVIELLPPGTETPLFRGEFEREMKGQKGMDVTVLVKQAIAGIEAGRDEIRPGLTKVLGFMSRVAPNFMMAQIARMSVPKK
jgi:uncharacterized oxidoreductase